MAIAWRVEPGFESDALEAIGGLMGLGSFAWAWWKNRQHAKVAIAATNAGVNIPAVKAAPMPTKT